MVIVWYDMVQTMSYTPYTTYRMFYCRIFDGSAQTVRWCTMTTVYEVDDSRKVNDQLHFVVFCGSIEHSW